MKRPQLYSQAIIEQSATEWVANNRWDMPELIGADESQIAYFRDKLIRAARSSRFFVAHEIASKLASSLCESLNAEMIDAVEDYVSCHNQAYEPAVQAWQAAYGVPQPFVDYARVTAMVNGAIVSGIGRIAEPYSKAGRLLLKEDGQPPSEDGFISSWRILNWEDVTVGDLTDEDRTVITRHVEAKAAIDAGVEVSRRKMQAKMQLRNLIEANDAMTQEEAASLYQMVAGRPDVAARIIKALTLGAIADLEKTAPQQIAEVSLG